MSHIFFLNKFQVKSFTPVSVWLQAQKDQQTAMSNTHVN